MTDNLGSRHEIAVIREDGESLGVVSASVAHAGRARATAIVAHGAGGTMDTPSIVGLQTRLAANGVSAVRFNFLYTERKKRSPDRQPVLLDCWRSVADWVKREIEPKKLFLGGRSMGGRMASYIVAGGYPCDGIFFVAYPLHPPGKRDRQRKEHLEKITVPMLFLSGTRDSFAYLDLLEPLAGKLGAELYLIEGADHGFRVPKKYGKTASEVEEEVARRILDFIDSVGG